MESVVGRGTLLARAVPHPPAARLGPPRASSWEAIDQILDRPVRVTVLHARPRPAGAGRRPPRRAGHRPAPGARARRRRARGRRLHRDRAGRPGRRWPSSSPAARCPPTRRAPSSARRRPRSRAPAAAASTTSPCARPSCTSRPDDRVLLTGLAVDGALAGPGSPTPTPRPALDTVGPGRAALRRAAPAAGPAAPAARPTVPLPHLAAAPVLEGAPVPPAELASGVPNDLDTLCAVTLGVHDDGPQTPGRSSSRSSSRGATSGATDLFAGTRVTLRRSAASPPRPRPPATSRPRLHGSSAPRSGRCSPAVDARPPAPRDAAAGGSQPVRRRHRSRGRRGGAGRAAAVPACGPRRPAAPAAGRPRPTTPRPPPCPRPPARPRRPRRHRPRDTTVRRDARAGAAHGGRCDTATLPRTGHPGALPPRQASPVPDADATTPIPAAAAARTARRAARARPGAPRTPRPATVRPSGRTAPGPPLRPRRTTTRPSRCPSAPGHRPRARAPPPPPPRGRVRNNRTDRLDRPRGCRGTGGGVPGVVVHRGTRRPAAGSAPRPPRAPARPAGAQPRRARPTPRPTPPPAQPAPRVLPPGRPVLPASPPWVPPRIDRVERHADPTGGRRCGRLGRARRPRRAAGPPAPRHPGQPGRASAPRGDRRAPLRPDPVRPAARRPGYRRRALHGLPRADPAGRPHAGSPHPVATPSAPRRGARGGGTRRRGAGARAEEPPAHDAGHRVRAPARPAAGRRRQRAPRGGAARDRRRPGDGVVHPHLQRGRLRQPQDRHRLRRDPRRAGHGQHGDAAGPRHRRTRRGPARPTPRPRPRATSSRRARSDPRPCSPSAHRPRRSTSSCGSPSCRRPPTAPTGSSSPRSRCPDAAVGGRPVRLPTGSRPRLHQVPTDVRHPPDATGPGNTSDPRIGSADRRRGTAPDEDEDEVAR